MKKIDILNKMKTTYQIEEKQTVLDHGVSVFKNTKSVLNKLKNDCSSVPLFMREHKEFLLKSLVDYKTLYLYCIYHDCGKPFCKPDS